MYSKFLKYCFLTGALFTFFITVQTCSRPYIGNKTLYLTDVEITYINNRKDTLRSVVFFDFLELNSLNDLIKKNGEIVSRDVKKFKYLNSTKKKL